jgi:hypothetical protein
MFCWFGFDLEKKGLATSPCIYLLVAQAQFSPHKQGLQVQFGLWLLF